MNKTQTTNLNAIVSSVMGISLQNVTKLHGDASYRTYYRAVAESGDTYIIMLMPEGKQSVSEEITNFNGTHQEIPFINVTNYLTRCGLPVPEIIAESTEHHILILEDLGDDLMAKRVESADEKIQRHWYIKAIDLLISMQKATELNRDDSCVAFKRSFDGTLFNWEFDHFLEYGIESRLNAKLSDTDHDVFNNETKSISRKLQSFPYCFTHRDFQSRNLLWKDEELHMIDYQDALLGPKLYDLVSLLRDSYVQLPSDLVKELITYYGGKTGMDEKETIHQFDLITIQRKLKDAGRFVFIDRIKNNPNFLQYIPTSLGYVKEAFERTPEYARLYDVLTKYIPEWI